MPEQEETIEYTIPMTTASRVIVLIIMVAVAGYCISSQSILDQDEYMAILIPIILGFLVEKLRLSDDWIEFLVIPILAGVFSLIIFIPTSADYVFAERLSIWPYSFLFFYLFMAYISFQDKIMPRLHEGVTLLLSISIIYWIIDRGFDKVGFVTYLLYFIGAIYSTIPFISAFKTSDIDDDEKVVMGLWSAVILSVFSVDYIYRVFTIDLYSESTYSGIILILQLFLVGVSLIYLVNNLMSLLVYLPSRGDKDEIEELRKETSENLKKNFSNVQISPTFALMTTALFVAVYGVNYYMDFLPAHTLIWLMLWLFPTVIFLLSPRTQNMEGTH